MQLLQVDLLQAVRCDMEFFLYAGGIICVCLFVCAVASARNSGYESGFDAGKGAPCLFSNLPVGCQYRVLRDEELHKANAYVICDGEKMLFVSSSKALHDTFVVGKTKKGELVPNHCST